MTQLLKGAPVAAAMHARTAQQVEALKARGIVPTLAVVRVGVREDDLAYERGAASRCKKVGVRVERVALPEACTEQELIHTLHRLNADRAVHGVLLLRPLPRHMDEDRVCNALAPEKDVDGITELSLAAVFAGKDAGYVPCTAQACMEVLDHYGIDPAKKRAVVVGRSLVVGKPLAMLLLARNATVTLCHTHTRDLPGACRGAELLFASAGRAKLLGAAHLSPGQVVVDVGINALEDGSLCGDVDFEAAQSLAAAITPVPGGVGAVTTSVLVQHVVRAAMAASGA